jgi:hypothetical protein
MSEFKKKLSEVKIKTLRPSVSGFFIIEIRLINILEIYSFRKWIFLKDK